MSQIDRCDQCGAVAPTGFNAPVKLPAITLLSGPANATVHTANVCGFGCAILWLADRMHRPPDKEKR